MQEMTPDTPRSALVTLTEADVKRAYWLIQRKATLTPVGLLKVSFLTILAVIGTGITYLQDGTVPWIPTLIFALLFPFVMVGLAAQQNGRAARRLFAQQKSLQRPFTLSWTAEGFALHSDQIDVRMPWGELTKVLHNDQLILLCESDFRFQTLPRRCLSPAQQSDVLSLAEAGLAHARPAATAAAASSRS